MLTKVGKIVVTALFIASVLLLLYDLARVNKEADLKVISYNEEVIAYNNTVSKRNTDLMLKQKLER